MQAFHILGPAPLYTNTYLLLSDAGRAVIIDPAAPAAEYDAVLQQQGAALAAVLCTHGHYDHVGSAEALCRAHGAKLYCEASDVRGDQMYPLTHADSGYEEGGQLAVDELAFTAWHTPGHTPGSVVLLCGSYLFTGDTLFEGSMGRTDLPGGSDAQMTASLRRLGQLPLPRDTQVLPGHGGFSTLGQELDGNYYLRAALRG